jgi:hypothetical protein
MTGRGLSKLQPGDLLKIKKGYTGYGGKAKFLGDSSDFPRLLVLMPGLEEPELRHHCMFSGRQSAKEGSNQ